MRWSCKVPTTIGRIYVNCFGKNAHSAHKNILTGQRVTHKEDMEKVVEGEVEKEEEVKEKMEEEEEVVEKKDAKEEVEDEMEEVEKKPAY